MSSPYCCTEQAMKILNNPEQSEAMMMEEVRWQITSIFLVHLPVYVFKEIHFVNELLIKSIFRPSWKKRTLQLGFQLILLHRCHFLFLRLHVA